MTKIVVIIIGLVLMCGMIGIDMIVSKWTENKPDKNRNETSEKKPNKK